MRPFRRDASRSPRRPGEGGALLQLDVGGVAYTAAAATLSAVTGSWLAQVAAGEVALPRSPSGALFVDRDGQVRARLAREPRG